MSGKGLTLVSCKARPGLCWFSVDDDLSPSGNAGHLDGVSGLGGFKQQFTLPQFWSQKSKIRVSARLCSLWRD